MSSNSAGLPSPRQTQSYQERRPGFCWHGGQISCNSWQTWCPCVCRERAWRRSFLPQALGSHRVKNVNYENYFSSAIFFIPVDPTHLRTLAGTLFLLTTRFSPAAVSRVLTLFWFHVEDEKRSLPQQVPTASREDRAGGWRRHSEEAPSYVLCG